MAAWVVALIAGGATMSHATEVAQYGGTKPVWPTAWIPLTGLNDTADFSPGRLDFVGDDSNPGAFWAMGSDYVYFRTRMNIDVVTSTTYSDSVFVLIDIQGAGTSNLPDYGFAWDTKAEHGLEMMVLGSNPSTWGALRMNDIDGNDGQKVPYDINTGGRTGDGFVRTIDGQTPLAPTTLGTTSFIDFAVSWDYLTTYARTGTPNPTVGLGKGQTWRVALTSINNSNDHNLMDEIAGGATKDSGMNIGWSDPIVIQEVPEPSSLVVLSVVAVTSYMGVRFRRRKNTAVEKASI